MKSDIKIFQDDQFGQIRVIIDENNKPLFCLADVCRVIEIANPRNVKNRLDEKDVHLVDTLTNGGYQQVTFVSESGLYEVIFRSESQVAKPFRRWVVSDVLPSIREHGIYMTGEAIERVLADPDQIIALATKWKEEMDRRIEVENENKKLLEDNKYKDDVIEGLVEEIPVADMRQRINQIVTKAGGGDFRGAWRMLFTEFDRKFHINVGLRISNSRFNGNCIDYIDKELNMVPELYELACKLFESTYDKLIESWGKYAKRAKIVKKTKKK